KRQRGLVASVAGLESGAPDEIGSFAAAARICFQGGLAVACLRKKLRQTRSRRRHVPHMFEKFERIVEVLVGERFLRELELLRNPSLLRPATFLGRGLFAEASLLGFAFEPFNLRELATEIGDCADDGWM